MGINSLRLHIKSIRINRGFATCGETRRKNAPFCGSKRRDNAPHCDPKVGRMRPLFEPQGDLYIYYIYIYICLLREAPRALVEREHREPILESEESRHSFFLWRTQSRVPAPRHNECGRAANGQPKNGALWTHEGKTWVQSLMDVHVKKKHCR